MEVQDVVIPAFGGDSTSKHRRRFSKQMQRQHIQPAPSRRMDYLELIPTKETTQMMRQVSGLGMEDPVFGLFSAHSTMARKAAKNLPHVFDDMGLDDIPIDMRDMVSVCSDPTASVVGELPKTSDIFSKPASAKQSRTDDFQLSSSSGLTNVTTRLTSSKSNAHRKHAQQQSPPTQKRSTRQAHAFVPPKSIQQLQGPEDHDHNHKSTPVPTRSIDLSEESKNVSPDVDQMKKKTPIRRFQKSTSASRLNRGSTHRSKSFEAHSSTQPSASTDDNEEAELDVNDLGKSRSRQPPTRRHTTSNNNLHSSDSRILFNYQRRRRSQQRKPLTRSQHRDANDLQCLGVDIPENNGTDNVVSGLTTAVPPMEGFDLKLNNDGYARTVSGLTTAVPAESKAENGDKNRKETNGNMYDKDNDTDDDESSEIIFEEFAVRTVTVDGEKVEVPVLDIKASKGHNSTLSMDETIFVDDEHGKEKAHGNNSSEGELLELMRSQQSLDFFDLQGSPEATFSNDKSISKSSDSLHLSFDHSMEKMKQEAQENTPTETRKPRRRSSRSFPKALIPPQQRRNTQAINCSDDSNHFRRQKVLSNKVINPGLDDSKLFRHSQEKSERKGRRSLSFSVQDRKSVRTRSRTNQRRRSGKSNENSNSADAVAARMLAFGNASLKAAEHAEELRSKHQRSFQVATLIARDQKLQPANTNKSSHTRDIRPTASKMVSWDHTRSKSRQRTRRRSTSRKRSPSTDFHASMNQLSSAAGGSGGLAKSLLKNLNRSMGDIDF